MTEEERREAETVAKKIVNENWASTFKDGDLIGDSQIREMCQLAYAAGVELKRAEIASLKGMIKDQLRDGEAACEHCGGANVVSRIACIYCDRVDWNQDRIRGQP